jgi:hypothetical protein
MRPRRQGESGEGRAIRRESNGKDGGAEKEKATVTSRIQSPAPGRHLWTACMHVSFQRDAFAPFFYFFACTSPPWML